MMKDKYCTKNPAFFDPRRHIQSLSADITVLKADEKDLISSPIQALKSLALELFREGKMDQAMQFSRAALDINPHVFNCVEICLFGCLDQDQAVSLYTLIPEAIFVSQHHMSNESQLDWAKFYKHQAEYKLKQDRVFSALKLFEMALACDLSILDNESSDYLPDQLWIIPYPLHIPIVIQNYAFMEKIMRIGKEIQNKCGIDHFQHEFVIPNFVYQTDPIKIGFALLPSLIEESPHILKDLLNLPFKDMNEAQVRQSIIEEMQKNKELELLVMPLACILAAFGYVNTLNWLLNKKDCVDCADKLGGTPLIWSMIFGQIESMRCLFERGVKIPSIHDNAFPGTDINDLQIKYILLFRPQILKYLVALGMDLDEFDKTNESFLMQLSRNGKANFIKFLLENGVETNLQNNEGLTALMIASYHQNSDSMRTLLDHGADIDRRDNQGRTALYHAISYGSFEKLALSWRNRVIDYFIPSLRKKTEDIRATKISSVRLLLSYHPTVLIDPETLPKESRDLFDELRDELNIIGQSIQSVEPNSAQEIFSDIKGSSQPPEGPEKNSHQDLLAVMNQDSMRPEESGDNELSPADIVNNRCHIL